jgi:hypothetical protein
MSKEYAAAVEAAIGTRRGSGAAHAAHASIDERTSRQSRIAEGYRRKRPCEVFRL